MEANVYLCYDRKDRTLLSIEWVIYNLEQMSFDLVTSVYFDEDQDTVVHTLNTHRYTWNQHRSKVTSGEQQSVQTMGHTSRPQLCSFFFMLRHLVLRSAIGSS